MMQYEYGKMAITVIMPLINKLFNLRVPELDKINQHVVSEWAEHAYTANNSVQIDAFHQSTSKSLLFSINICFELELQKRKITHIFRDAIVFNS